MIPSVSNIFFGSKMMLFVIFLCLCVCTSYANDNFQPLEVTLIRNEDGSYECNGSMPYFEWDKPLNWHFNHPYTAYRWRCRTNMKTHESKLNGNESKSTVGDMNMKCIVFTHKCMKKYELSCHYKRGQRTQIDQGIICNIFMHAHEPHNLSTQATSSRNIPPLQLQGVFGYPQEADRYPTFQLRGPDGYPTLQSLGVVGYPTLQSRDADGYTTLPSRGANGYRISQSQGEYGYPTSQSQGAYDNPPSQEEAKQPENNLLPTKYVSRVTPAVRQTNHANGTGNTSTLIVKNNASTEYVFTTSVPLKPEKNPRYPENPVNRTSIKPQKEPPISNYLNRADNVSAVSQTGSFPNEQKPASNIQYIIMGVSCAVAFALVICVFAAMTVRKKLIACKQGTHTGSQNVVLHHERGESIERTKNDTDLEFEKDVYYESIPEHVYETPDIIHSMHGLEVPGNVTQRSPYPLPPEALADNERYRHYDTPYEDRIFRLGRLECIPSHYGGHKVLPAGPRIWD